MTLPAQPGILESVPAVTRYVTFNADAVADGAAMFRISRPVSGAYLWCPPVQGGGLDLRRHGL
jgi:putative iron-dependent peroxidase